MEVVDLLSVIIKYSSPKTEVRDKLQSTSFAMEKKLSDSATEEALRLSKASPSLVQNRIRALNVQKTSQPSQPASSTEEIVPPSKTPQLHKAASAIRKSLKIESYMFGKSRSIEGTSPSEVAKSFSPRRAQSEPPDGNSDNEEELEIFKRLLFDDESQTVLEVDEVTSAFDKFVSSAAPVSATKSEIGRSTSVKSEVESGILSPPSIFRTVTSENVDIAGSTYESVGIAGSTEYISSSGVPNTTRRTTLESSSVAQVTPSKIDNDESPTSGRTSARRSRIRSPRKSSLTSPNQSIDSVEGTESIKSTPLTWNIPSFSTRARRFLKDKKDRRRGIVKQEVAAAEVAAGVAAADASQTPQTVNLKPAVSNLGKRLLKDKMERRRAGAASAGGDKQDVASAADVSKIGQLKEDKDYDDSPSQTPQTVYLKPGVSSTSTDLFENVEEMSSITSYKDNVSIVEVESFPRGRADSNDEGCQAFDLMNPLPIIESAFSALSIRSDSVRSLFGNPSGGASKSFSSAMASSEDVDKEGEYEDVAIEVEYVENIEEQDEESDSDESILEKLL